MLIVRKWLVVTSLGLAAASGATACGTSTSGASSGPQAGGGLSKSNLTIAVPGISAASAFLEVAGRSGIFKENGLDVTLTSGVKPPDTPAAMIRGSIDGGSLTGTATKAHAKGLPVVNVVATATHEPFVLMATSGIRSLQDLVGKSIVTSAPTDTPGTQTAQLLRRAGLTGKVKVIGLTSTAAESALFVSKQADAEYVALNQALNDSLKRTGATIIMDNSSLPKTPSDGIAVAQSFISAHPDTVQALVKSCLQAAHMMKAEPAKAAPYVEKAYHLNASQAQQFLQFQGKNIDLAPPSQQEFKQVAAGYSKAPNSGVNWTSNLVAQSWDTKFEVKALKELGYSS